PVFTTQGKTVAQHHADRPAGGIGRARGQERVVIDKRVGADGDRIAPPAQGMDDGGGGAIGNTNGMALAAGDLSIRALGPLERHVWAVQTREGKKRGDELSALAFKQADLDMNVRLSQYLDASTVYVWIGVET